MSTLRVTPAPQSIDFSFRPPGSKSHTQRAFICAALAGGASRLGNVSPADDVRLLVEALRQLGIRIDVRQGEWIVQGQGGVFPASGGGFQFGNAGAALRFFTALSSLGRGTFIIDGDAAMRRRPVGELVGALSTLGASISCAGGCPPVRIEARGLEGGRVDVDASRSSQFLSALLLAGPYMERGLDLRPRGPVVSEPYVALTRATMAAFGVEARRTREGWSVTRGRYRPAEISIHADAAGANYFLAVAAVTGGRVRAEGIDLRTDPEAPFIDVLERMGCSVKREEDAVEISGAPLRGIDVNLKDLPDSAPTLAVVALFAKGPTRIRGIAHLRWKETDRLEALACELTKCGATVEVLEDGLRVEPPGRCAPVEIDSHGDHRMAMSFSIIGAVVPITIRDAGCVIKSYPGFFEDLKRSGLNINWNH